MIIAARLRLKRVISALALVYTVEPRDFSSGLTMQLGAVIIAARLRLRRVILALALLYTAESACFFQRPDDTARFRDCRSPTPIQAREFSADTATHGNSKRSFQRPDAARFRDCRRPTPTRARDVSVARHGLEFVY